MSDLKAAFDRNFSDFGEVGASVAVWNAQGEVESYHQGVADRSGDIAWTAETLVPVWSATKGPAATVVLGLLAESKLDLETPVAEIWPELSDSATVGEVMSHQAGFAALDEKVSIEDKAAVFAALEAQTPNWSEGHGYHPRTFGFLMEGLARKLDSSGRSLGEIWREKIADRLELDFWIGLPESEHGRVAELRSARVGKSAPNTTPPDLNQSEFFKAFGTPDSLTRKAFVSPAGYNAVSDMNQPSAWTAGWPAMGGVGSATALAKFYAVMANGGRWQGEQLIPEIVTRWAETTLVSGIDQVLCVPTAFSAGFMRPPSLSSGGRARAFGHPGAGGSHAFADPEAGIGFAYVMNQMEQSVLPNLKSIGLVSAL